jgi:hypothetical protein
MNASGEARLWARRGLGLALALSMIATACGSDDAGTAAGRRSSQQSEGVAGGGGLPSSEVEMADGTRVALTDVLDGRPLVVNFASWCGPAYVVWSRRAAGVVARRNERGAAAGSVRR